MSKDIIWKHRVSFAVPTHWVFATYTPQQMFYIIWYHLIDLSVCISTDDEVTLMGSLPASCVDRKNAVNEVNVLNQRRYKFCFEQCEMLLQGWTCSFHLAFVVLFNSRHVQLNLSHLEITVCLAKFLWLLVPDDYLLSIFLMLMPKPQAWWAFWKDQSLVSFLSVSCWVTRKEEKSSVNFVPHFTKHNLACTWIFSIFSH